MNPATFLRVLGPERWRVCYVEPSVRPDDSRYGENPNRLQQHTQFQARRRPTLTLMRLRRSQQRVGMGCLPPWMRCMQCTGCARMQTGGPRADMLPALPGLRSNVGVESVRPAPRPPAPTQAAPTGGRSARLMYPTHNPTPRGARPQVILKPDPGNPQELYLGSLQALGIDTRAHDVRASGL